MSTMDDFTNFSEDEEPSQEDIQIAYGALQNYVRHNRLGKLCVCQGCMDMRNAYARIMQISRIQDALAKEGEEWKKDAETDL